MISFELDYVIQALLGWSHFSLVREPYKYFLGIRAFIIFWWEPFSISRDREEES